MPGTPGRRCAGVLELVRAHVDPEGDIHGRADYRRMLVSELTRRALVTALCTRDVEGEA
jgi:carbon-monoxide dehydrogenase medium subunit